VISTSGLETPSREPSPTNEEARTPKASHLLPSLLTAESTNTPTASGSNTPTAATDESRKGKSFLGFVPFTDFLRARYPSTSQSSDKTVLNHSHSSADGDTSDSAESEDEEADDEDRVTIHGVAREKSPEPSAVIAEMSAS